MRLFGLRETRREKWPMGWSWLGRIRWLQNQTPGSRHLFSAHARPLALGHKRRVAALLLRAIGLLLLLLSPTYPDVSNCGGKINSYFYPGMRSLPRFLQFLFLKFKFKTIRITKSYFGRVSIFKNEKGILEGMILYSSVQNVFKKSNNLMMVSRVKFWKNRIIYLNLTERTSRG